MPSTVLQVIEHRSSRSIGVSVSATEPWIVAPNAVSAHISRGHEPPDVKIAELLAKCSLGVSDVMGRSGAKQLPSNSAATRRAASRREIWNRVLLVPTAHSAERVSFIGVVPF